MRTLTITTPFTRAAQDGPKASSVSSRRDRVLPELSTAVRSGDPGADYLDDRNDRRATFGPEHTHRGADHTGDDELDAVVDELHRFEAELAELDVVDELLTGPLDD